MVAFTNIQLTNFFTNGPQMSLTAAVRLRLSQEGLTTVDDFTDFKEDQLLDAFKNMRTSIPGVAAIPAVLDADNNVVVDAIPAIAPIPPTLVSAKCGLRLKIASQAFHYYKSIEREVTPANMNYTQVLKDFYTEYESVIALSSEAKPDVPLLHKNNTPLKWIESFRDCLFRTYGLRKTPLLYVVRKTVEVLPEAEDALLLHKAYGTSGSILDELIARLAHDDPLYKSDNATVYSMLEEATRGTVYASTVKPHSRRKDGRSAWLSMLSSHAGNDKWEQLQQARSLFMMNTKWNGRNYSLEKFTGMHRSSYVQLQEASTHVHFQLPTEHTRVGYLLSNITNADPDLKAALASIRIDTNGMRGDFEAAVAFILPVDPYSKQKRTSDKTANVSDANALQNKSQSRTGVDLRWHNPDEYKKLTKEQRIELYAWQRSKDGSAATQKQKAKAGYKGKPNVKKRLQSKVAKLEAIIKDHEKDPSLEELTACIQAATATTPAPIPPRVSTPMPQPPAVAGAVRLLSILKRKRGDNQQQSE
jgi:hypothetical protein